MIRAPFTPEQVHALNAWQANDRVHGFTCGNDRTDAAHVAYQLQHPDQDFGQLVATAEGWVCPVCTYRQDWAHDFMAEPHP
jgi:hypothetical protein